MTVTSRTRAKAGASSGVEEKAIIAALRKLPPDSLPDVLRYIEFLDYKLNPARDPAAEDAALWAAVEANQEYKQLHPTEGLEIHESGADFLKAMADL
jgi:hypothetical protein